MAGGLDRVGRSHPKHHGLAGRPWQPQGERFRQPLALRCVAALLGRGISIAPPGHALASPPCGRDPALTRGVLVSRSGHTSARELTPDDVLVPLGLTRRLGAADQGSRRILNQGHRLLEEADAR